MKPLARWTIGNSTPDGYKCLWESIASFQRFYDLDVAICYNCDPNNLGGIVPQFRLINQEDYRVTCKVEPKGVAWKLYPTRLDLNTHEIAIDNDIIIKSPIAEIDEFLSSDCTLLLEGDNRTYGRFERHVPPGFNINSGIYGMPPGFNLQKFLDFYVNDPWEKNAFGQHDENFTFDEQGLIATALLSYKRFTIIPQTSIANCEHELVEGSGHHFIGLNRRSFHRPYRLYKTSILPLLL
jgi:hypothetical protein